ncbi:hypothetical protein F5Y12DRAFT_272782 [Xylaria sp. FL1777]|nr:hypothetical protein F5Y12DRAFT_272782 [Xylaria sp. FL1777]
MDMFDQDVPLRGAFETVRFHGRYYARIHDSDTEYAGLGRRIVDRIPDDPAAYQKWLRKMRARYAAYENSMEKDFQSASHGFKPSEKRLGRFEMVPTELPGNWKWSGIKDVYIINLDHEVFTVNFSMHWKLGNIPRQGDLWLRSITSSTCRYAPTVSLDICPEEHLTSLALELPKQNPRVEYDNRVVTPKTDISGARKTYLTYVMALVLKKYASAIIWFGREWTPDSFPFRELAFALASIASSQAGTYLTNCYRFMNDMASTTGWLDKDEIAPLLDFGSMSHLPGNPAGVSPAETMYWFQGVLISLTLVIDGEAINKTVTWGIKQGCASFQAVILTLFEVAFVEVSPGNDGKPFVHFSKKLHLSPVREEHCLSSHPRDRPELKPSINEVSMDKPRMRGLITKRRLQVQFPGLTALVNFFDAAMNRCTASKSTGVFPLELYDHILDFVDYDTWKACTLVSAGIRARCFRRYMICDSLRIVRGPLVRLDRERRCLSFDFQDIYTGIIEPCVQVEKRWEICTRDFTPVIGSDRKAIMSEVGVLFDHAKDEAVQPDSEDEQV